MDRHAISMLHTIVAMTIALRNIAALHASIWQSGEHLNIVATSNKLLADICCIEGLRPIVLADNEDPHLAPSPLIIVRIVRQMMPKSSLTQRFSM